MAQVCRRRPSTRHGRYRGAAIDELPVIAVQSSRQQAPPAYSSIISQRFGSSLRGTGAPKAKASNRRIRPLLPYLASSTICRPCLAKPGLIQILPASTRAPYRKRAQPWPAAHASSSLLKEPLDNASCRFVPG
jgi:hypothetical protein